MVERNSPKIRFSLAAVRQCSVLVIEDDESISLRLSTLLKRNAYEVFIARSTEEALLRLHRSTCSIVLAAWEMPGLDGIAICRELRLRDKEHYTYMIMLTLRSSERDIIRGLRAGADDCVAKSASARELLARLVVGRRITRLERSLRETNEEDRRLAETDSLTGAHNHRFLVNHLPHELERARRYRHPISILGCDLDDFKQINDRRGHETGDQVLQLFVERAMGCLRISSDWIVRSGGDEFIIVLPETGLSGASCVAQKIRSAMTAPLFATSSGQLSVTVSVGATALETPQELMDTSMVVQLRAVGTCLYASKNLGRDRTTCAPIALAVTVKHGSTGEKHKVN